MEKWGFGRYVYFKNVGKIINNCKKVIIGIKFVVYNLYGFFWGLYKEIECGNMYIFFDMMIILKFGECVDFVYI